MDVWPGLCWHSTQLCKQSDELHMSQDTRINKKYSTFIQ
jgi:hypothetical protein